MINSIKIQYQAVKTYNDPQKPTTAGLQCEQPEPASPSRPPQVVQRPAVVPSPHLPKELQCEPLESASLSPRSDKLSPTLLRRHDKSPVKVSSERAGCYGKGAATTTKKGRVSMFRIKSGTWLKMTGVTKSNGLVAGWTNILYEVYASAVKKPCVLAFQYGHRRCMNSRKPGDPLFTARARCKFEGCCN